MSPLPKVKVARWLIASSLAIGCSLQMPKEDEVFSTSGGRTGNGGASNGAGGTVSEGGTLETTGGKGGESGKGELGGAAGMNDGGQSGEVGGAGDAGSPSGGAGEGGEPSTGGSGAGGTGSGGAPKGGSSGAGKGGTAPGGGVGGAGNGGVGNGGVGNGGVGNAGTGGVGAGNGGVGNAGGGGVGGAPFNPEDGLVAHFPFDELSGIVASNRKDATKNGVYYGSCGHPTGRFGRSVSVRNSATQDWIELPPGLLSTLSATTVIIWVRDLSVDRKGSRLFDFGSGTVENIFFSPDQVNPATSLAGGHLGGVHASLTFVDLWTTTANLTDKTWHQVAFSWTSEEIAFYVDAVLVGTKPDPTAIPSALGVTSPNWLGRSFNDVWAAMYAEIDDLRIYDKALSASEIGLLYGLL